MTRTLTLILIMGLFSKLFGQSEKKNSEPSVKKELQLEFNIMKNISLEKCQKYENSEQFKLIENGIYQDLNDDDNTKYRMTISYNLEPENDTNNQYPLEDILDKYYLHVSDFLESENNSDPHNFKLELAGELDDLKSSQKIIGKKVYNQEFKSDDGQIRVNLIIE
ncbi:hypothetical protein [Polaribacter sp. Hel1_33_49]|uniref:hypothetical protein n=1 Tax=Polaribacter sp. Hel1_33_49 TaxID=1336803 RepID=UPI00052E3FE9|nr:hypothetical protein [Polaribacter sp. Hel1_33_49]KGL61226.1 hypothetical protein PHEL49_2125 [Polaribacter sp. Hel1_33_49]